MKLNNNNNNNNINKRRRIFKYNDNPIQLRLWVIGPLIIAMIAGISLLCINEYRKYRINIYQHSLELAEYAETAWGKTLNNKARYLRVIADNIVQNNDLISTWQDGDENAVRAIVLPLYVDLKSKYNLTHLNIINPDRTVIMRGHIPEKKDDLLNKQVLLDIFRPGILFCRLLPAMPKISLQK